MKAGFHTAEVHYLAAWCALAGVIGATPWLGLTLGGAEIALACAVLGVAGIVAWSTEGVRAAITAAGLALGAICLWSPALTSVASAQTGLEPDTLILASVSAALVAAGLALSARGLRRGETGTMLLGALVALGQVGIVLVLKPLGFEGLAIALVMATVLSGWLLSARVA